MKMEDNTEIFIRDICYRLITRYDNGKPCTIEAREAHGFRGAEIPNALEKRTKEIHAHIIENFPPHPGVEIVTSFSFIDDGIEYSTKIIMKNEHA